MQVARFNSVLPTTIEVLEDQYGGKYKLLIGNKTISAKSEQELSLGSLYWGTLKESKISSVIKLSNLIKQPSIVKNMNILPRLDSFSMLNLLSSSSFSMDFKSFILENMSNTNSKFEFMYLLNILQGVGDNIFSFVLNYGSKDTLFQFKKRKNRKKDFKDNSINIDFYAAFENLGPVEGYIESVDDTKRVTLYLHYEDSIKFLKRELRSLDIEAVVYKKDSIINPLIDIKPALLDIKG
jgi:hypothetical protein